METFNPRHLSMNKMNVLREYARQRSIKNFSMMRKKELIHAISELLNEDFKNINVDLKKEKRLIIRNWILSRLPHFHNNRLCHVCYINRASTFHCCSFLTCIECLERIAKCVTNYDTLEYLKCPQCRQDIMHTIIKKQHILLEELSTWSRARRLLTISSSSLKDRLYFLYKKTYKEHSRIQTLKDHVIQCMMSRIFQIQKERYVFDVVDNIIATRYYPTTSMCNYLLHYHENRNDVINRIVSLNDNFHFLPILYDNYIHFVRVERNNNIIHDVSH